MSQFPESPDVTVGMTCRRAGAQSYPLYVTVIVETKTDTNTTTEVAL